MNIRTSGFKIFYWTRHKASDRVFEEDPLLNHHDILDQRLDLTRFARLELNPNLLESYYSFISPKVKSCQQEGIDENIKVQFYKIHQRRKN